MAATIGKMPNQGGPTFGSVFAGIGGFDLGLESAGWKCLWQIEIDKRCASVLARHWPDVRRFGDITKVRGEDLEPVNLICGGFPCQDLSTAGKHRGLTGERSGLFFEFARITKELHPAWVLVENVPGLLSSSGGRDMGAVLGALGNLGYHGAYRVLDAQYFGVAQRRRRVFIVGHHGPGPAPAFVLLDALDTPARPVAEGGSPLGKPDRTRCLICDGSFVPSRSDAITCGGACRQKAYRIRRKIGDAALRLIVGSQIGSRPRRLVITRNARAGSRLAPPRGGWGNAGVFGPGWAVTFRASEAPRGAVTASLSDTLETEADWLRRHPGRTPADFADYMRRYRLSPKAARGILRRAEKHNAKLPPSLRDALERAAKAG